ncbi:MAG TPA: UDP-3-O-(3-hydroxymyristoyl)glucosamine N-acyltransferase [Thermoanaerobaculia bacterium]|nr:UDP-3-O-(3-hydroxymyristoyl)glucosamine N-acyltransferase [Thermoanaerobaculia bacterium]
MMRVTAGEIADFVEGTFTGDRERAVTAVRPIGEAGEDDLTFLSNPKFEPLLATTRAALTLVGHHAVGDSDRWIRVGEPQLALARVLERWFSELPGPQGISGIATIHASASIGGNPRIGARVTISERCVIGDDVTIFDGVFVGAGTSIGNGTVIHPNVTIYHATKIGARCIVHAGVVIGSDGYGFATSGGKHHKIPQIGSVRIEDDVEIGAGSTVDRAALGETVIGEGTKIDNLVHVGHNVKIGKHCLIVAQVGIAGSTEIGDFCVLAGQVGVTGHVSLGSGVQVAAQASVMKSFEGPQKLSGSPARPMADHLRAQALVRRLPEIIDRLKTLERESNRALDSDVTRQAGTGSDTLEPGE